MSYRPASIPMPELPAGLPEVKGDEWSRLMRTPSLEVLGEEFKPTIRRIYDWVKQHVRPYRALAHLEVDYIDGGKVILKDAGVLNVGRSFAEHMQRFHVDSLLILAVTLGDKINREVGRLWEENRFEESYMLSAYAAALTEACREECTHYLMQWAEQVGWSVLYPAGPGYNDWPTDELGNLYRLASSAIPTLPEHIQLKDNCIITPIHSVLVTYGVIHHMDESSGRGRYHHSNPCSRCTLAGCPVRRVPFDRRMAGATKRR